MKFSGFTNNNINHLSGIRLHDGNIPLIMTLKLHNSSSLLVSLFAGNWYQCKYIFEQQCVQNSV